MAGSEGISMSDCFGGSAAEESCSGTIGELNGNGEVTVTVSRMLRGSNSRAGMTGESGRGIEAGEGGKGIDTLTGAGEALADISGVLPFEASPMANVARSLSSRFGFGVRGKLALLGVGPGLPDLCIERDFRRLVRADSAN